MSNLRPLGSSPFSIPLYVKLTSAFAGSFAMNVKAPDTATPRHPTIKDITSHIRTNFLRYFNILETDIAAPSFKSSFLIVTLRLRSLLLAIFTSDLSVNNHITA